MAELKPFPYQNEGIEYGLKNKRFILGDEPGLGKTVQSIKTVLESDSFPCLVICPASLKLNWQREWHMWSDRKAMILNDANRHSWWMFAKPELNPFGTGAKADVFIVNYESLKKYFVQDIARGELKLSNISFRPQISMFKSVIIDEAHRCFPYNTKINTNKGLLDIGAIVKNKDADLLVESMDLSSNSVSYKRILNYYDNEKRERDLYRVNHQKGMLIATEGHKIYVDGEGYKEIQEIKSGDYLRMVRGDLYDSKGWKINSQVLRKVLRLVLQKLQPGNKSQDGRFQKTANRNERMQVVRRGICGEQEEEERFCKAVLQSKLFCKMENGAAWSFGLCKNRRVLQESKGENYKANGRPCIEKNAFRKNEEKQPNDDFRNEGKSFKSIIWKAVFRAKNGQWSHNRASKIAMGGLRSFFRIFRISCFNERSDRKKFAVLLQNRYCFNRQKNSNRSRWTFSQSKQDKNIGQEENGSFELVRVESCEIHKPRYYERFRLGNNKIKSVYDIEVEDNHNYFANGILVHNCKDPSTQQSKFAKGIVNGKDFILALTGTPIVNTQEDLVSILGILDRLKDFGGASMFRAKWLDKAKLPELGERLKETCFIRRRKSEVLKDLPAKLRSIFPTELSNQEEYDIALNDLKKYLVEYKQKTDAEAARLLRMKALLQIGILKGISARGKIDTVVEHVNEVTKAGEKIVLFCHLREVGTALKEAFPDACVIRGGMAGHMKQANIDRFQNDPEAMVCICSIKAAGVGITLTASSRVSFVELPWHPADLEQCEDRAHRIGQHDSVQCTYFLGKGTIDNYIYQIIDRKREIANLVTGDVNEIEVKIQNELFELLLKEV